MVEKERKLLEEEKKILAKTVKPCLQCGVCTSTCPPARFSSEFNIRKLALEISRNDFQQSTFSKTIWKCFLCFECVNLCPNNVPLPEVILFLRGYTLTQGLAEEIYNMLKEPIKNLFETGAIVPYGRINLRKYMGLPPTTKIPKESLKKLKKIFEKTGFKENLNMLESIYTHTKSLGG